VSLLNWRSGHHFDHSDDLPACTQCGITTAMRSHQGEPVHKVCAEGWNEANPAAPRYTHQGRDLGTERFHSDPPTKHRKGGRS
jgi:hypothetical protein